MEKRSDHSALCVGFRVCASVPEAWNIATTKERRAFPLHFFKQRSLAIVFILEFCASTLTYIPVYFIPLYFQFVRQDTDIVAGVRLLRLVLLLVAAIVMNAVIVTANGRYMPWFVAGGALGFVGSALLYTLDVETSDARVYGYSILIGTGAGFFLQLVQSLVSQRISQKRSALSRSVN